MIARTKGEIFALYASAFGSMAVAMLVMLAHIVQKMG